MAVQKPCECKPVVVIWIGYSKLDFSDRVLSRQQRRLLRDIVCRPVKFMKFTGNALDETNFLGRTRRILDVDGATVGYGALLNVPESTVPLSDEPCFVEAWMDELGRAFEVAFDLTYLPRVYATVGRADR
jgi:hypothetical protein